jgi:hypothetical protein
VAREPATPDIRLMRDFADMRPVDIARAYGYQRIAALLDPGRPVELLAYITSGAAARAMLGACGGIQSCCVSAIRGLHLCVFATRSLQVVVGDVTLRQGGGMHLLEVLRVTCCNVCTGGHMRLGPPALAALAARALRGRLLSELAAIEPRCNSNRTCSMTPVHPVGWHIWQSFQVFTCLDVETVLRCFLVWLHPVAA